jgi:predicted nuclease of predicted toxin-antitoxin system
MRILIDMNLVPAWVEVLQGYGESAAHWSEVAIRAQLTRQS